MKQEFVLASPASESQTVPQETFFQFIWRNKINRRYLLIAVMGTIVQFLIFKILYPFPDFFSDSYSYLYAAYANLDVSIWPIGYSKFLRWFHFITYSDTALIAFQYFFLELGALYFFFSIQCFLKLSKVNRVIFFIFLFFNPLSLYLSNYINSDPLFAALSLFWISELLHLINRSKGYLIITHAILLFLCFSVRNNAYYYPIISVLTILIAKRALWFKTATIILSGIMIIVFIVYTREAAYKLTGTRQYSLFTGWQMANNALYIYEFSDTDKILSPRAAELEEMSKSFYTSISQIAPDFHKGLSYFVGNFFIRSPYSPLKKYMTRHYKITDDSSLVVAWGKSASVFKEYGGYIIKNNFKAYISEFALPNTMNYFLPPLEKLEVYNLGIDDVFPIAQFWFHYPTSKIHSRSKTIQGSILSIYPILFFSLNVFAIISLFMFWVLEKYKFFPAILTKQLLLLNCFLALNFLFCIGATIIVLRYEFFPFIICLVSVLLLSEYIAKRVPEKNNSDSSKKKIIGNSNYKIAIDNGR